MCHHEMSVSAVGNVQSGVFGGDEEFGGCVQVGVEFGGLRVRA